MEMSQDQAAVVIQKGRIQHVYGAILQKILKNNLIFAEPVVFGSYCNNLQIFSIMLVLKYKFFLCFLSQ